MTDETTETQRDQFRSKRGFILASIGSAVGMGNIWRFPAMVSLWGGLTFIIPYLIFVVLITATGVIAEFALGRAARAGPSGAFGMCTELRWGNRKLGERIGLIPVVGSLALAIGYTCVMAWITKYMVMAFTGDLSDMGQDMGAISGMFDATSSAWGANIWVVIAAVITLLIMSRGVSGGIEKANKFLMPVLFILLIALAVYVGTLPGASAGYSYILTVDFGLLAEPLVWIFAFGQAFFSLSVAGNGSVVYGSYFGRKDSIPSSAFYVGLFDTVSALLAAAIIIPAMTAGGADPTQGGLHPEPVRDPRGVHPGEARGEPPAGDPVHGRPRGCRRTVHTVHRVPVDGRRVYLHLPAGGPPGRGDAVLGRWTRVHDEERQRRG